MFYFVKNREESTRIEKYNMSRRFFYSVRLFAGCFPFAVARILFESQNTGVEPRNTLSTFFSCFSCFSWLNNSFDIRVHSCPFVVLTLFCHLFRVFRVFRGSKKHTIYIFSWFVPSFSILQSVMPSLKIAISRQWLTSLRAGVSPDAIVRTVSRNSSTFGFAMASQSIQCGFFCARE